MLEKEDYYCFECGTLMKLVDGVLVCPKCGHSVDLEYYFDEEEDYEALYGTGDILSDTVDDFPEEFPSIDYEDTDE